MDTQADIAVYDSKDNLALVVEVKNKRGTNSDWAAKMRRNILGHSSVTNVQYFLLALPDRFYLWVDNQQADLIKPTYDVDAVPILRSYFELAGVEPEDLTEIGFELLVRAWLNDLIWGEQPASVPGGDEDWLISSGLLDAIKQGHFASEITL